MRGVEARRRGGWMSGEGGGRARGGEPPRPRLPPLLHLTMAPSSSPVRP
jgi:hypothetical protein